MPFYISAKSGDGKTRLLIRICFEMMKSGKRVIIIVPTKKLANQIYIDLMNFGIHYVTIIHGDTHLNGAVAALDHHLKNDTRKCQVLVTTQESFDRLAYFSRPENWVLMIDEAPKAFEGFSIKIPDVHQFLTNNLAVATNAEYSEILVTNKSAVKKIRDNINNDVTYREVHDLTTRLLDEGWTTYVNTSDYANFLAGKLGKTQLEAYAIRDVGSLLRFKKVIVAGAYIEDSFYYQIMKHQGLTFTPYPDTPAKFKSNVHGNGKLLEIHYLNTPRFSKTMAENHPDTMATLVEYAKNLFGSDKFLWLANSSVKSDLFPGLNGQRLSGAPHGMNCYQNIDNVVILSAYNTNPQSSKFLKSIGIDNDAVDKALHISNVYQAIMRCSLRDIFSTSLKRIIVPDERTALWLHYHFPGSKLFPIAVPSSKPLGKLGRPPQNGVPKDAAQRKREQRQREKDKLLALKNETEADEFATLDFSGAQPKVSQHQPTQIDTSISHICPIDNRLSVTSSGNQTGFHLSLYPSIASSGAESILKFSTADEWIDYLKTKNVAVVADKYKNELFMTTTVKPNIVDGRDRTLDAISGIHSLVFDIDGGDISVDEFIAMFPNLRFCIHNTWSSTIFKPRWRAIFPTRYMTVAEHGECWDGMMVALSQQGYTVSKRNPAEPLTRAHGIDPSKRVVTSMFFLPCQANAGKAHSFFHDLKGEARGLLDPDEWRRLYKVARPLKKTFVPLPTANHGTAAHGQLWSSTAPNPKAAAAIQRWRTEGVLPGRGNGEFFILANALAKAGMPSYEIEHTLKGQAKFANTPPDRLRQIPGIMDHLAKYPQIR